MSDELKILIVDDSNIIINLIKSYISGYNVKLCGLANDGITALKIFKEELPDIVTLDITMPDMDGLTVLDEMLKIKKDTKIVMITALSDKATALRALSKGAFGYLNKPFKEENIKNILDEVLK